MKKITLLFTFLFVCSLGQSQVSGVFDGSSSILQFQEDDDNTTGATARISADWTYEFWVKSDAAERGFPLMVGGSTSTNGSLKWATRGDLSSGLLRVVWNAMDGSDIIITDFYGAMDGSWHHVAVVGDDTAGTTNVTIYLDGVVVTHTNDVGTTQVSSFNRASYTFDNTASSATSAGSFVNFTIGGKTGASSANHYFAGEIDEVRSWTRALSAGEVVNLAACTTISTTGLHRTVSLENNTNENSGKAVAGTVSGYGIGQCAVLSAEDRVFAAGISVYPNPVRDIVTIEKAANVNLKSVALYSILGNEVYKSTNTTSINVSNFAKGLYLLKIESNQGAITTKKLIVE